jgi:tetratricopeptide (TPR) repeat protein
LSIDVDVSLEATAADLAEDAVDPSVPVAQRMQAVMQLANIDLSYKRFEEAARKFAILYDYYEKADAPIMQAMTLQGAGDCYRFLEQHEQALLRYQQGLAIAMAAKSPLPLDPPPRPPGDDSPPAQPLHPNAPPALLNLLLAAGGECMVLREYEDACSYYESASKVAAKCMNPFAACDALQGQGDAHRALRQLAEALKVWKDCETIAQTYEYYDRLVSVLERMLALYEQGHMRKEADEARSKLEGARLLRKKKAS